MTIRVYAQDTAGKTAAFDANTDSVVEARDSVMHQFPGGARYLAVVPQAPLVDQPGVEHAG